MPDDDKVTLRDHFQSQLHWLDRYFDRRLLDAKDAIDKAENQLNARLEGMNEFRDTLKDQASKLATKDEVALSLGALEKRMQSIERILASGEGHRSVSSVWWVIGGSILTGVVVGLILKAIK